MNTAISKIRVKFLNHFCSKFCFGENSVVKKLRFGKKQKNNRANRSRGRKKHSRVFLIAGRPCFSRAGAAHDVDIRSGAEGAQAENANIRSRTGTSGIGQRKSDQRAENVGNAKKNGGARSGRACEVRRAFFPLDFSPFRVFLTQETFPGSQRPYCDYNFAFFAPTRRSKKRSKHLRVLRDSRELRVRAPKLFCFFSSPWNFVCPGFLNIAITKFHFYLETVRTS